MLLETHQTFCRKTHSLSWALASSLSARHAFCPPASFSTCCEYFVCASSCSRTQSKELQNRQSRRKVVATAITCCLTAFSLSRALASLSSSALCTYFSPDGAHLSTNSASQSPFACVIILVSANANTKSWVLVCVVGFGFCIIPQLATLGGLIIFEVRRVVSPSSSGPALSLP